MPSADRKAPGSVANESREDAGAESPDHPRAGDASPAEESEEPRGIETGIADADKQARTGSRYEPVRNTPPAGAWNDTASD